MKPWLKAAITILFAFTTVSAAAQESKDGVRDGINLHGKWVLEVRNPDGSLVERRSFTNALTENGKTKLARMLTGSHPLFATEVTFNQHFGQYDPLPQYAASPICVGITICRSFEVGGPYAATHNDFFDFATLTVTNAGPGTFVLQGWIKVTAPGGGHIQRIATLLHEQSARIVGDTQRFLFTLATLPTPLFVPEGQIVQFTYTLSFS
jgi:hypothetical protein